MRTISFYSYKGGTGRTLLVANLAVYAARLGRKVVMVDLDLEAPGLAYKFLKSPPNKPGLLEWLLASNRPDLKEMAVRLPVHNTFNAGGALWMIGAGPPPSIAYLGGVRRLQSTAFADDSTRAIAGMLDLRVEIAEKLQPDFLFLDARTGISNNNAITTRVLADDVVALTLNTPEQLEGTRIVLQSLAPLSKPSYGASQSHPEPLGLHVVISRVTDPPRGPSERVRRDRDSTIVHTVRRFLTEPAKPLSATLALTNSPLLLHNDPAVAAEEHLLLAQDTPPHYSRVLHFDYLRVAERLLGADVIGPAVAEAFRGIDDFKRLERADFFGDVEQALEAKAPFNAELPGNPALSRSEIKKKVDLVRRVARKDATMRPELAEALIELAWATFWTRTSTSSNGLSYLREAEGIFYRLAQQLPERYNAAHVDCLVELSSMAAQLGENDEALRSASRALDRASASVDDDSRIALEAKALFHLASLHHEGGDLEVALREIRRALKALRREQRSHTAGDLEFGFQYASALDLATAIEAQSDTGGALNHARQAARQYQRLYEAGAGSVAQSGRARALTNLANLQRQSGNFDQAIGNAELAANILRSVAGEEPQHNLQLLAEAVLTLSASQADAGRHQQAAATAESVVSLRRDLSEVIASPQHMLDLISALSNFAVRLVDISEFEQARDAWMEAIQVCKRCETAYAFRAGTGDHDLLSRAAARAWAGLASVSRRLSDDRVTLHAAEEAATRYEGLGEAFSGQQSQMMLLRSATLLESKPKEAYSAAVKAISLADRQDPQHSATAELMAARAAQEKGDLSRSVEHAGNAAQHYAETDDPIGLALTLDFLAVVLTKAGDSKVATQFAKQAADLRHRIIAADSSS